jgi:hypothetical protein
VLFGTKSAFKNYWFGEHLLALGKACGKGSGQAVEGLRIFFVSPRFSSGFPLSPHLLRSFSTGRAEASSSYRTEVYELFRDSTGTYYGDVYAIF